MLPEEMDGHRLDRIVAQLTGLSRAEAKALVAEGAVTVEGVPGRPTDSVGAGSRLEITLVVPDVVLEPEPIPFGINYEDEHIAVVDKPSGVVTHPGAGVKTGTLAGGLLHRWPQIEGVGSPDRWGLVHRLDRETSGLLLVALTTDALAKLQTDLADRRITRSYLALAHGHFPVASGTVDAPIGRDPRRPTRMAVSADGRPARTHYSVEQSWATPPVCLVAVTLDTGRTHQIRVHLASISHPVVGDLAYGHRRPPEVGRVWLHARHLSFDHPDTGSRIEVTSPLPPELQRSLDDLGPSSAAS